MLARKGTGVAPADKALVSLELQHRISVAWVNAIVPGGVFFISVYMQAAALLNEHNMAVLAEVAAITRTLKAPWIIAPCPLCDIPRCWVLTIYLLDLSLYHF